ncbi:IS630 transposase-related protein [Acinetobacter rudis]|uniref:IS630 transposase-related protein n=1 Tax=Acinetobacter rudis TaxID=632955 RepID=A0AAW8J875_9GAMM|nr:IS630 transposase-related protein [Acinetobacter rudis]MDQ8935944.1 IS630 transposase-related protein [Acinetobacter rudis]MDQ8953611.1 IS630 transposase-related protein [Acinetobacter rudis]MDQ9018207.1 IS630 transposase-related protein [Acinetobacter rudis]
MTYPVHFRKKILAKLEQGMTFQEAAAKFELSPTTIQRWKKKLEPKTSHDYKPRKLHDDLILRDVKDYPNDFQYQRAVRLNCSKSGIQKALKRLGIIPKKK